MVKARALLATPFHGRKSKRMSAITKISAASIVSIPMFGSIIKVTIANKTRINLLSQSDSKSPKANIITRTKLGLTPKIAKLLFWMMAPNTTAPKLLRNINIPKGFNFKTGL